MIELSIARIGVSSEISPRSPVLEGRGNWELQQQISRQCDLTWCVLNLSPFIQSVSVSIHVLKSQKIYLY
jgi:hypothetical protein